jgi:hypothetical protein
VAKPMKDEGLELLRQAQRRIERRTIMRMKTGQGCILERWHYQMIMRSSTDATATAPRRTGPRARGAGRPGARRVTSTRAGPDDSDPEPGEPARGRSSRRTSLASGIGGQR